MQLVTLDVLSPFPARLLAARLGAEGILWQLRGESSVYPLGPVEVLVEADSIERAREVAGLGPPPGTEPAPSPDFPAGPADGASPGTAARARLRRLWLWLAVVAVIVGLALRVAHVG